MPVTHILNIHPLLFQVLCAIAGLIAGSFLNVVIYRLPVMLMQEKPSEKPFNLLYPPSHCRMCHAPIRMIENIPLISFIFLKGKCRHCKEKISRQYPAVELASAVLAWLSAWYFGPGVETLGVLCLLWSLLALSVIDFRHRLLPDIITLPLLWLGLLVNTWQWFTTLESAVLGAIIGYLSLWSVYWIFKFVTGKEGMGYGDFKLLAALGAWCGWESLPMIVLLASLSGTIAGLVSILFYRHNRHAAIAFGPWLAGAGVITLFLGDFLETAWLSLLRVF